MRRNRISLKEPHTHVCLSVFYEIAHDFGKYLREWADMIATNSKEVCNRGEES